MSEHTHAEGIFCDDCPDAMRQLAKKVLVEHHWMNGPLGPPDDRDCRCGWRMPYTEEHQHAGHVADMLSAAFTTAGFQRPARSADMEARIRALADEWDSDPSALGSACVFAGELRALLDAAPAGGAEQVTTREEIDRVVEPLLDAPSEVPHD